MKVYSKKRHARKKTSIVKNGNLIGDTIEIMMLRLMNGEGIESVEDRDLVYNDGETNLVNPITNIRSDKMELMLDQKIDEQDYKIRKIRQVEEKDKPAESSEGEDVVAE